MLVRVETSRELASQLNADFLSLDRNLNEYLRVARDQLSESEFHRLRRSVGDTLGIVYIDVMKNIYATHPEIKPPGMP